ncbi:unnamed protein product [Lymnaea stagnalis]|uniref:Programmed cell death protein 7 n=1 Tax=Lymnaea stagnalis TaxID=6523 RepID=A0AAV2H2I2_LYMST
MSYNDKSWNQQNEHGVSGQHYHTKRSSSTDGAYRPTNIHSLTQNGPPPHQRFQQQPRNFCHPPVFENAPGTNFGFSGFNQRPRFPYPLNLTPPQPFPNMPPGHRLNMQPVNQLGQSQVISTPPHPSVIQNSHLESNINLNYTVPPPNLIHQSSVLPISQQGYGQNFHNPPFVIPTNNSHSFIKQNVNQHMESKAASEKNIPVQSKIEPQHIGTQKLQTWLQKVGKLKKSKTTVSKEEKSEPNTFWSSINQLRELAHLLTTMSTQVYSMAESCSSLNNSSWEKKRTDFEQLKLKYCSSATVLEEHSLFNICKKLTQIKKKRKRLNKAGCQKFESCRSKVQEREEKSHQIDKWQERIQVEIREENLRKARKEAADQTLSKVTREIHDASRLIETMLALQKLRLVRRDAAQKRGDIELGESRQVFEEKIADMMRLVQSQLDCYKEEEAKLKQVIQSEQEEKSKKERLVQEEKDKQKQQAEDEEYKILLFGFQEEVSTADPIFPYAEYYKQAEASLQAFVQIRHEWDTFLVPANTPAASPIPASWVIPDPPSSLTWALALK